MDLDDVIPSPHYRICHSRVARAPLPAVWDALHRVTMSALPLGHALEGARILPARAVGRPQLSRRHSHSGAVLRATPCRYLSRPQPGLAPAGRIGTAASGRGGPALATSASQRKYSSNSDRFPGLTTILVSIPYIRPLQAPPAVLAPLTIVAPDQVTCRHRSRRFTAGITGTRCCQVTPVRVEAGRWLGTRPDPGQRAFRAGTARTCRAEVAHIVNLVAMEQRRDAVTVGREPRRAGPPGRARALRRRSPACSRRTPICWKARTMRAQ